MKIKFGSIIENINQMNNDIYSNQTPSEERIYIDFKDTHHTAQEVVEMINTNYTGTLTIVYEDDIEESFTGYKLDNVRKMYGEMGVQLTAEFVKLEELPESDIIE